MTIHFDHAAISQLLNVYTAGAQENGSFIHRTQHWKNKKVKGEAGSLRGLFFLSCCKASLLSTGSSKVSSLLHERQQGGENMVLALTCTVLASTLFSWNPTSRSFGIQ
jgi:hypothetical protein